MVVVVVEPSSGRGAFAEVGEVTPKRLRWLEKIDPETVNL